MVLSEKHPAPGADVDALTSALIETAEQYGYVSEHALHLLDEAARTIREDPRS